MKMILLLTILFSSAFAATTTHKTDKLKLGRSTGEDIYIFGDTGTTNLPYLFYDFSEGIWKSSNDGLTSKPFGTQLTTKGNVIGFDGTNTKECVLTGSDGDFLKKDSTADCGYDFDSLPDGTLQGAYGVSTQPQITVNDTNLGLQIRDAVVSIAEDIFSVLSGDGLTKFFNVDNVWAYIQGQDIVVADSTAIDGEFVVRDSTQPRGYKYTASLQGKLNPVTDWVEYTPTIQGFGAFNTLYSRWRRVGDSIEISIRGNIATRTAQEVQIGLPTSLLLDNSYSTVVEVGRLDVSINTEAHYSVLATGGDSFFNVGFRAAGGNGLFAPSLGSAILSDSAPIQIIAKAKIQGWSSGLDAAVQNIELTAQTKNEFFVQMNSDGTVAKDEFNIINTCVESGTGGFQKDCTFNSNIFTVPPIVVISACGAASDSNAETEIPTATGFRYYTRNLTNTQIRRGVCFVISKDGADVNKSQVIAGTFEGINSTDLVVVEAQGNGGESITANSTNIPFIEVSDNQNAWNGSEFTAPKDGIYTFDGLEQAISGSGRTIDLWIDKGAGYVKDIRCTQFTSSSAQKFNCNVKLEAGHKVVMRSDVSHTLNNLPIHTLLITQSADHEAIVKNLNDNNNIECQTKFLSTNVSAVGILSDLTFNNLTIGKKYSVNGQLQLTTGAGVQTFNNATSGSNQLGYSFSGGSQTIAYQPKSFVATQDTLINYSPFTNQINGNGTISTTWITLCELPDNTILNSNKWD